MSSTRAGRRVLNVRPTMPRSAVKVLTPATDFAAGFSTMAWIAGPSVGALLYKNVHERAPALLACTLFIINMLLAAVLLPSAENKQLLERKDSNANKSKSSFTSNLGS